MRRGGWIALGAAAAGLGAALWPGEARAQGTSDEGRLADAERRLRAYLAAAKVQASVARAELPGGGYGLVVVPGAGWGADERAVAARGAELLRSVTGVEVQIRG